MWKRLLPVLLLLVMVVPAEAAPARLLILGDSLSAGYGVERDQGWVELLQQRLAERGYGYRVVNASISGDTTSGGRARLPAALARHRPAVVVLELGGNDGLRGLPLEELRANLEAMIAASRAAGARVLLIGVPMPPNYGDYAERFGRAFRDLAAAHDVALVPDLLAGVAERRSLMQSDGIHPTAEAQVQMLDNVWLALEPLLRGESPGAAGEEKRAARCDRVPSNHAAAILPEPQLSAITLPFICPSCSATSMPSVPGSSTRRMA